MDFLARGATYYSLMLLKLGNAINNYRRGMISKGILILQNNSVIHNSHTILNQIKVPSGAVKVVWMFQLIKFKNFFIPGKYVWHINWQGADRRNF